MKIEAKISVNGMRFIKSTPSLYIKVKQYIYFIKLEYLKYFVSTWLAPHPNTVLEERLYQIWSLEFFSLMRSSLTSPNQGQY